MCSNLINGTSSMLNIRIHRDVQLWLIWVKAIKCLYVASLLHAEDILSISVEGKIAQSVCLYGTNSWIRDGKPAMAQKILYHQFWWDESNLALLKAC